MSWKANRLSRLRKAIDLALMVALTVLFVFVGIGIHKVVKHADQKRSDFWEGKCFIQDIEGERTVVPCSELSAGRDK